VRLKPGDDEGGHNMQFLQGLPSNLRHITTNGFGALRKRSRSAPLKLFFFLRLRRARLRLKIGTEIDFRNRLSSVTWCGSCCCSSGGRRFYHNKFPHNQCARVFCV